MRPPSRRFLLAAVASILMLRSVEIYAIDAIPTFDSNCYNYSIGNTPLPSPVRMIHESVYLGLNARQTDFFQACIRNEENLIRRAGVYALSGWLNDQGRMTDKISCTESH